MSADIVVIGGGPAGITASIFSARQGKKVCLITHDFNGVRFSSGLFDVVVPPENFPESPLSALRVVLKHYPQHILTKILRNEDEFMEVLDSLKAIYPFFKINTEKFLRFISDMGTLRVSWGALEWICSEEDVKGKDAVLVWPEMLMGRTAEQIAESLKYNGVEVKWINFPFVGYGYYSVFGRREFLNLLSGEIKGEVIIYPPFGRYYDRNLLQVFPTMESINGVWLEEKLKSMLKEEGVNIIEKGAVKVIIEKGRLKRIVCDDGEEIEGDVFLFATGKFNGWSFKGLEGDEPYHGLLPDLKLNLSGMVKSAVLCNPYVNHSQKFFSLSVEVDERMRALNRDCVVYENLFCAGSVIANVDPFSWMMGFGFSALTGILAIKRMHG